MGVAAQKRGDAVIARQVEHKYTAHDLAVVQRQVARENDLLRKQVDQMEAELITLRQQVMELELLRTSNAKLKDELIAAEERNLRVSGLYREQIDVAERWRHSHEKLSAIVILGMTPEEYHRYRDIAEMHHSNS